MATPTYDLLESVTLATSATSVTFSSIDQSYGDLILVATPLAPSTSYFRLACRFNSDSGTNYSFVSMTGSGSATYSNSAARTYVTLGNFVNLFSSQVINQTTCTISDYSATDKHKSTLTRANTALDYVEALAGRWANTSAITRIQIFSSAGAGSFPSGSTFNLYGVAK